MTSPFSTIHYQQHLNDLQRAISARHQAEEEFQANSVAGPDETEKGLAVALAQADEQQQVQLEAAKEYFSGAGRQLLDAVEAEITEAEREHRDTLREIETRWSNAETEIQQTCDESTWVATSVLDDEAEDSPKRNFERFKSTLHKSREEQAVEWLNLETTFEHTCEQAGWAAPVTVPEVDPKDREVAGAAFVEGLHQAQGRLDAADRLWLPKLFRGLRPLMTLLLLGAAIAGPVYFYVDPQLVDIASRSDTTWMAAAGGAGLLGGGLLLLTLYVIGSMQFGEAMREAAQYRTNAGFAQQRWLAFAKTDLSDAQKRFDVAQAALVKQREAALDRYRAAHAARVEHITTGRLRETREATERHQSRLAEIHKRRDECERAFREQEQQHYATLNADFVSTTQNWQSQLETHRTDKRRQQAQAWHELKTNWNAAASRFEAEANASARAAEAMFPTWDQILDINWTPPTTIPSSVRLGDYSVDLEQWEGAISTDARLAPRMTRATLPAAVPFPHQASTLFIGSGTEYRQQAINALQGMMLRFLTSIPPGKVRFTILDPIGLGESFSGFMHLIDFDELLINKRIWTESGQMEARLADMTEHMENVLQKYLRNEFATIEEYNERAGEVAEPYHVLVVNDFPAKFSDIAARRLVSIITSGPRCGVYTLLNVDTSVRAPSNFPLDTIREQCQTFEWRNEPEASAPGTSRVGRLTYSPVKAVPGANASGSLSHQPIIIAPPPPPDIFNGVVRKMGELAKDMRRVEVSFERVAPPADEVWSRDSRKEIIIPLGRAGATKMQQLELGRGTSQHMLIAGKTGSGKSTFLHTLITNVALHYSPLEVNFYLVDFKKGVEFKDYGHFQLPHARVVAIESDREFGVSVLQRLDAVLQERGELFRRAGVQDIAGYRNAHPDSALPRIMLVIDEFQEFFIEDDKLSQAAALLLDRIIRQGRAFGMHVVLGSQTLGGAYTLARSTLGQVAVRVALQCSEADAHLILSEENTAARLLTRPGEAIYNDANGMLEGNHPFQIAWLSDTDREKYLLRLKGLADRKGYELEPPVVFEGNIPSDPARNVALNKLIESPTESTITVPTIWLGEAVEIGDPATVPFHSQTGTHVLLVGQDSEAALGVMATALVTLAAQSANNEPEALAPGDLAGEQSSDRSSNTSSLGYGNDGNISFGTMLSGEGTERTSAESRNRSPVSPGAHASGSLGGLPPLLILDGSLPDSLDSAVWRDLAARFPTLVRLVPPREIPKLLTDLTAELKHRASASSSSLHTTPSTPHTFLFIYNLSRLRDLKKADDDFGLGGFGMGGEAKPAVPGKLFADLLSSGPEFGMHTLIWCDSSTNLERWISRNSMKDLERRIAFQMNAADSSNLIDTPAASRLGVHRALCYHDDTGTVDKFRPYGLPTKEWLDWSQACIIRDGNDDSLESAESLDGISVM